MSAEDHQLFHEAMKILINPLIEAGHEGIKICCMDGLICKVYQTIAAYITDYPEQCLVVGCKESTCPWCTVSSSQCGDPVYFIEHDPKKMIQVLQWKACNRNPMIGPSIQLVPWGLIIFACIMPDLLHQLHKGIFKDHIINWASEAVHSRSEEIDQRFHIMTPHSTLQHFKKGISLMMQWTGTEHKNMEKVFLGVLANATDLVVIQAVHGVLNFIYYVHFKVHTNESLAHLDAA